MPWSCTGSGAFFPSRRGQSSVYDPKNGFMCPCAPQNPVGVGPQWVRAGHITFYHVPVSAPCAPAAAGDRTTAHPAGVGGQNFTVVKFFLRSKFCLSVKILSDQASDFPSMTSSTMTSAYFSSSCSGVTSSPRGLPGVRVTSCLSVYPKWFFPRKMPDTGLTLPLSI